MRIFFNSSLPRSGSTLLQNVLAQNPDFYCSQTSGLLELLYAARQNYTTLDEFKLKESGYFDKAWHGFCKGAMEGFYSGLTDRKYIVDKSRGWQYYHAWLEQFYPNPKLIFCVRDLRSIISSMEKMHRRNAHLHDPADNPAQMNFVTVDQRVGHWMAAPPVGLAIQRLMDAVQKGSHRKFFFFVYERFMESPEFEMRNLYAYLGLDYFLHDFKAVKQVVTENDNVHGVYGDHVIRSNVAPLEEDWDQILGSGISQALVDRNRWFYDMFYRGKT